MTCCQTVGPVLASLAVARTRASPLSSSDWWLADLASSRYPYAIREVTRTARQFWTALPLMARFGVHQSFATPVDPEQNDFLIDAAETHEAIVAATRQPTR